MTRIKPVLMWVSVAAVTVWILSSVVAKSDSATRPAASAHDATASPAPTPAASVADASAPGRHIPLIGEPAPAFKAVTTQGNLDFPADYKGKWVILFSHPGDFTPVCTTEFMAFATAYDDFRKLNCELLALSVDSNASHIAWIRRIQEKIKYKDMENVAITFPIIADSKMEIAKTYGMLQPSASDTKTVRAVFFIDPEAKVRAIVYYPLTNGRNIQELKRLLTAMQTSDAHACATPADWQPGDDVIVPSPASCSAANDRVQNPPKDATVVDWFLTFKKLPKEQK